MASSLDHGGHAILSGILIDEREMMVQVLTDAGWRITEEDREENWWSTTVART
jgi:ribosomal protein L11 methyltransferase